MIKVFIPQDKTKKAKIRGLWINDDGKLYYDYLYVINAPSIDFKQLEDIKKKYKQEAVFYVDTSINTGNIYYGKNKIDILNRPNYWILPYDRLRFKQLELRQWIRRVLQKYRGLIISNDVVNKCYIIEVYYKR